jgi:Mn-dependent DtxR family transcriptional regulator
VDPRQDLTDRQERVLAFVESRKRPVSTKMIAETFLITTSEAAAYLKLLADKDLIDLAFAINKETGRTLLAGRRK